MIWIFFPAVLGIMALIFRRIGPLLFLLLAASSLILTWLAWQFPIDQVLESGPSDFKISSTFSLLGRSLTLLDNQRPILTFIFFINSFWLLGAYLARPGILFGGASQLIIALLIAALSVDPFLYAAIFIALIVLVSIPILAQAGRNVQNGLLRYLSFELFGVPFILFVGWILAGVEASPGNSALVFRAGILLLLGFAFLMALFPFHSWLPMLAREAHPYSFAFIAYFLPFLVSLFALGFFQRYAWIRETDNLALNLVLVGAIVSAIASIWAFIQNDLPRQMGFLLVAHTGTLLLALGLFEGSGIPLFFALSLSHFFAMLLWGISISGFRLATQGRLSLAEVSRIVPRHAALLLSFLISIAAFVALPFSFSLLPRLSLMTALSEISSPALIALAIGQSFLLLVFLKNLSSLALQFFVSSSRQSEKSLLGQAQDPLLPDRENPLAITFLVFSLALFIIFAFFPSIAFENMQSFLNAFPNLAR